MAPESFPDRPAVPDMMAPECPIPWQPNALAPVFYGYQDIGPVAGVPTHMRVLYPTLDGSPQSAQILAYCGLYPLIVFTHGQCSEAQKEHYLHWGASRLVTQLARAGYVVVVPQLSGGIYNVADHDLVRSIVAWMRGGWEHSQLLAPSMGAIGHSMGANLAGFLATEPRPSSRRPSSTTRPRSGADAFVGLSEVWDTTPPLISVPQLHVLGGDDVSLVNDVYEQAKRPKHRLLIAGAKHYDYLPVTPCQPDRGPCSCTPEIAADVVTLFFGTYLPPPAVLDLPQMIPSLLTPPPPTLSPEQELFAGGYLGGFSCLDSNIDHCSVKLSFDTGTHSETESIPWPPDDVRDHRGQANFWPWRP